MASELRLSDGTVTAEGVAVIVRAPEEFYRDWEAEKPYWRVYDE